MLTVHLVDYDFNTIWEKLEALENLRRCIDIFTTNGCLALSQSMLVLHYEGK